MKLPSDFLTRPIAHRGLHAPTVAENSLAAMKLAVSQGYGIELDLQLSGDRAAMVFHDETLDRMTQETGRVRARPTADLQAISLKDSGLEGIPTLAEVLNEVYGQVPLLIELKDQSGGSGGTDGALETATAAALDGYHGPVAVMSFNPDQVAKMAALCPKVPRGITSSGFRPENWSKMPPQVADHLRAIPDVDRVGASFISHDRRDLDMPRVAELKAQGLAVLTWTIRSPEEEAEARLVADNVTFEGYRPPVPAH